MWILWGFLGTRFLLNTKMCPHQDISFLTLPLNPNVFHLMEAFQCQEVPFINCQSQNLYCWSYIQEVVSLSMCSRLLFIFSSISFSVTGFTLRSFIHLDFGFVHYNEYGSICILLRANIQLCQHHLFKMSFFFSLYSFGFVVKNEVFLGM